MSIIISKFSPRFQGTLDCGLQVRPDGFPRSVSVTPKLVLHSNNATTVFDEFFDAGLHLDLAALKGLRDPNPRGAPFKLM